MRAVAVVLLALATVSSAHYIRSHGSPSFRRSYGASGSQVGFAPGRHGSSQLLQRQPYGSSGRQVHGLNTAQVFRPQSSYAAPAHQPQRSYAAPVHQPQSSYAAPAHQPQSSYAAPAHQPQSSYAAPEHQPQSSYASPVHQPQSSYAAPVHRPQSSYSAPAHQPQSSYAAPVHKPQSSYAAPVHQPQSSYAAQAQGKYFFSWRAPDLNLSDKYTWQEADYQCTSRGYKLVSLDQADKDSYISAQLTAGDISYVWTSGVRTYSGFVWGNGTPVAGYTHWSNTGGNGTPQPDNRERPENCLAVLNNVYDDGVIWHDINCEHKKHFVCEIY